VVAGFLPEFMAIKSISECTSRDIKNRHCLTLRRDFAIFQRVYAIGADFVAWWMIKVRGLEYGEILGGVDG
jgi:hypothetical protein